MKVKLLAPAKINLTLNVGEKLSTGYHDIDTIMQAVSLFDIIEIAETEKPGISVFVSGPFAKGVPTDESNICVKAAKLFITGGIDIHIEKNIPHGAGLGGGSSDAAAVIIGLNAILGRNESESQLELAACNIGADVPFFIRGGLRRAKGIGMDLSKDADTDFDWGVDSPRVVIAMGKERMSTKTAYEMLDCKEVRVNEPIRYFNSFSEVVINDEIEDIKRLFHEYSAHAVSLSGSGTAVYAVFGGGEYKNCQKLKYKMREEGFFCETVEPVAHGGKVTWAQI